jgi:catechol 2,3-dioxygenase-like lactoylglutathione lyase family enzyme
VIRFIRTLPLPPKLLHIAIIALMATPTTAQPQGLPVVVSEPAFFAVSVADLEASTRWYQLVFGLETLRDVTSRDGRGRARVLMAGELVVELIAYQGSVDASEALQEGQHRFALRGLVKTGLFVTDADAAHAVLSASDIDIDDSVGVDERIDAKTFLVRDPDGNRLQIFARCLGGC